MKGWTPVSLKIEVVEKLDKLKKKLRMRGRSEVVEYLIEFYEKNKEVKA